jgi:hypothetical protein
MEKDTCTEKPFSLKKILLIEKILIKYEKKDKGFI